MPQRRYTERELEVIKSGERDPYDAGWYVRPFKDILPTKLYDAFHTEENVIRNLGAGAVNILPQVAEVPHLGASLIGAASDKYSGKPFGESFYSRMEGGPEAQAATNEFMSTRVQELLNDLPENERNDPATRAAIEGAVKGSKELHEFRQKQLYDSGWLGALSTLGTSGENLVNKDWNVAPTYQQDIGDETAQFIGGAVVPTPTKLVKAAEKLPGVLRWAAHAMIPGSAGKVEAAVNTALPTAIDTGLRAAQDAPGWTDPSLETIIEQPAAPVQQRRYGGTTPMMEDATEPSSPFSLVSSAQAAEGPGWAAPFLYGASKVAPTASTSSAAPSDPQLGGGGDTIAKYLVAGGASLALIAAGLRGKIAAPHIKQILDDVDSPSAALRMQPTVRDVPEESALTTYQKRKVDVAKPKAIKYAAKKALVNDPNVESKVANLERLTNEASPMEVGNAHARTLQFGEMPLLGRNTVPLEALRARAAQELTPDQLTSLKAASIHADRIGYYDLQSKNLQDEVAMLHYKLSTAKGNRARNAISQKIAAKSQELQMRYRSGATLDDGTDVKTARQMVAAAQNDAKVNGYLQKLRQIVQDVDESKVREGLITRQYLDDRLRNNPDFLPSAADPHGKLSDTYKIGARILDKFRGRTEPGEGGSAYGREMYGGRRGPTRSYKQERAKPISEMRDPFEAVDDYIREMHQSVRHNRTAKNFVDLVQGTDDWGRTVKKAAEPVSARDYENGKMPMDTQKLLDDPHVFLVNDNGMIHFMRATDYTVARAMRHNPSSILSGMDWFRRLMQQTYTSSALAPWFGWRAMRNEQGVIRAIMPAEYTAGYIQKALKAGVPNTAAYDKAATLLGDPTFNLRVMSHVAKQMKARTIKRWADYLGRQLMQNSTLVQTFGEARVRAQAETMVRSYNDTLLGLMTRRGQIDNLKVMEQQASIFKDIDEANLLLRGANAVKWLGKNPVGDAILTALGTYVDFADSLRNAPRIAFYAENFEGLLQKYKGNIPQSEVKKLNAVTMRLTGDITRGVGAKALATGLSISPYGVNSLNSLAHIVEHAAHDKGYITSRIVANMILPKVMWRIGLGLLIGEEFERWYNSDIPIWQRQSTFPMLSPQYFIDIAKNGSRKPTVDDVMLMPLEPEAILPAEVANTGLAAIGWFDAPAKDAATGMDILRAMGTMVSVNVPIFDLYEAAVGKSERAKYERETLTGPSEPVQRMIDMSHAVFGGVVDLIGNAASAGSQSLYRGRGIVDAFSSVFSTSVETVKEKMPETPLTSLFGGQRRHYTKTQVRDRNQGRFEKIRAVSNMLTTMNQAGGGLQKAMIRDPRAFQVAQVLHTYTNSGPMKVLKTRRTALYRQIEVLDENRDKLPFGEYTKRTEKLKKLITAVDHQEEEMFNRMDTGLAKIGGIDGAIKMITQSIAP